MNQFFDVLIDDTKKAKKIKNQDYQIIGKYPIIDQSSELVAGYRDLEDGLYKNIPAIIFGDHTRRFKIIEEPFFIGADGTKVLRQKNNSYDYRYLYYYLSAQYIPNTGYNRHFKWVKLFKFPNISVIEQARIVKKLDLLSKILIDKKSILLELDELIKSRFIELFGDPLINTKNWDIKKIKDIATEIRYGTSQASTTNGRYKYLRMNNLTYGGEISLADIKYIDLDEDEIEKYMVCKGDILFNRTNSIDLIGKTAVFQFDEPMIIAGYIIRIRLKKELLPDFFAHFMNLPMIKLLLKHIAKGAVNQANINARELGEINIYVPDLELQKQFIVYCNKINKLKFAIMVYN